MDSDHQTLRETTATLPLYREKAASKCADPTIANNFANLGRKLSDRAPSYAQHTTSSHKRSHLGPDDATRPPGIPLRDTTSDRSPGLPCRNLSKASTIVRKNTNQSTRLSTVGERATDVAPPDAYPAQQSSNRAGVSDESNKLAQTSYAPSRVNSSRTGRMSVIESHHNAPGKPRAKSKSRLVNNIKGLFSGKSSETAPPLPTAKPKYFSSPHRHEASAIGTAVTQIPPSPVSRQPSTSGYQIGRSPRFPQANYLGDRQQSPIWDRLASGLEPAARVETQPLTDLVHQLVNEASQEKDMARRERLYSVAMVMSDAISSCTEAERNMERARQAADAAKVSYELTQFSVLEMGKLLAKSHHTMPSLLKRFAARTSH